MTLEQVNYKINSSYNICGKLQSPKGLDDTSRKTQNIALQSLYTVGSVFKKVGLSVLTFAASPILLLAGLAHATIKAYSSSSTTATWKKVTRYLFDTYFCKFSHATGFRSYTRCSDIRNGLFLGGMPTEGSFFKELKEKNIKTVISLNEDFELKTSSLISKPVTADQWETNGIDFHNIASPDFEAVPLKNLDSIANKIKEAKEMGAVYVHCKAGTGRSASAVVAYLIKYENKTVEEAIAHVQACRPCVRLSHNHLVQVKKFALLWRAKNLGTDFHEKLDQCNSLTDIRKLFCTYKLATKKTQYDVIADSATVEGIKKALKENPLTPRFVVNHLEKYEAAILSLFGQPGIQEKLKASSNFNETIAILQQHNVMIRWKDIPPEAMAMLLLSKFSNVFSKEMIEKMLGITADQMTTASLQYLEDHKEAIYEVINHPDFLNEYSAETSHLSFPQIKDLLKKHGPTIPWGIFPEQDLIKLLLAPFVEDPSLLNSPKGIQQLQQQNTEN